MHDIHLVLTIANYIRTLYSNLLKISRRAIREHFE